MKRLIVTGVTLLIFLSAPVTFAATATPSATATASAVVKVASGSTKQVLGETKVLGSTGTEKDIAKWVAVVFGGIAVLFWALKTVRSNAED